MNNLSSIRYLGIFAILGLVSCSTSQTALRGESDDLYFMASDAEIATEFAVENNNPENFEHLEKIDAAEYDPQNFSAKNVNPEYLAKYQSNDASEEGSVYFDDSEGDTVQKGDINIYNNFRGYNAPNEYNPGWNMSPWMLRSMYMGGFSPFGMGGFYDPFMGPGFGFRPGLSMSLGMGFGMGSMFGMGYGHPMMRYGYGMGGFYDPFYSPFSSYMGYGYGYGMNYYNRPIIILPGGSENQRQIVRGGRPSRGSFLPSGTRRENIATPGSTRATARREAVRRNTLTSTPSTRANSRSDFSRSENDYYNSARSTSTASAAPSSRNINSPAMSRAGSTSNRNTYTSPERTTRTQAPSNVNTRRSSTDTRSRYAAPSRSSSPSYNRSSSREYQRSTTPSNSRDYSTPSRSRSSSPSFSAPSRSSGSSGGGTTRSSGGSSRRGN